MLDIAVRQQEICPCHPINVYMSDFFSYKIIVFLRLAGIQFNFEVQDGVPVVMRRKYEMFVNAVKQLLQTLLKFDSKYVQSRNEKAQPKKHNRRE